MAFALTGAKIFDGEAVLEEHAVVIEGTHIADVVEDKKLGATVKRQRLDGGLLAPGFIDVQVNGGGGVQFNDCPTLEGVKRIAAAHRRYGTTGLLPTVITDAQAVISSAIEAVEQAHAQHMPGVLGIHVEGPFIDPKRKGAHDRNHIRTIQKGDVAELTSAACGAMMVTVAPNCVGAETIARLAEAGIIVSLGHSDATAQEAEKALASGACAFTHLYNAMSQLTGRAPNMVGAALSHRESFCSIIADGHHVNDESLKIALLAKPKERVVLITDAMCTAAGGPDEFLLQGRPVKRIDGRLQLENGTLAGSNLTMDEAVRYCVNQLEARLEDALRMASLNPAALIGLNGHLGKIKPGYLASLVHLSDDLRVLGSWVEGEATGERQAK